MRQLLLLAVLLGALPVGAVDIEWVPIGDPGNPPDDAANCHYSANCGSVDHDYSIAKYEVTNAQYAELLNAKAASDPLGLYSMGMGSDALFGGIEQTGADGSYGYPVKAGFENLPVTYVSFYDALRFANWLHNGKGSGDTETGAYTLAALAGRNPGATRVLPNESEWYKAAYYSPAGSYFDYPTGTDTVTGCVAPGADTGNSANCATGALTLVGAYGLSPSPYGTFDQGGNLWEWIEELESGGTFTRPRGGNWQDGAGNLGASASNYDNAASERDDYGFRVASLVPEPAQVLLVLTGGLMLALARRQRRA
jgi:formylglycine-generating enzyme required for sulfatase activity